MEDQDLSIVKSEPLPELSIVKSNTGPHIGPARIQEGGPGSTPIAFPANKANPELSREDNTLFGMPPEVAVLSGLSIGRAIGAAGLTAAGRAVAGLKAVAGQVTPVIKYEAVKSALTAVGLSPALATAGAMAVAGYKKGAAAGAVEAAAPEAEAATAAPTIADKARADFEATRNARATGTSMQPAPMPQGSAPAPVAAAPPPTPQPSAPAPIATPAPAPPQPVAVSPQAATNALGLAAARAKVPLTLKEIQSLIPVVQQGTAPADAIAAFVQSKDPAAALAKMPGMMTDAEVQAALDARNNAGKIKTPSAETARARKAAQP